ncbi:NADPH:quinone oxidoreductase family protein [Pseudonocardia charpentierae]|uniref:NADPH:quinone oxidoreductase family protein n=1 Tax=Pseudonocardia charpentierae TaxID=3075545 RepID=A0ABU2NF64_9PSEU|nr:NADPH:quinone oxidoreductase family protein [Pseudonocardia sp. DSM 45834]MDT0352596.1 NADPH:quinone oxidoreductase family protein [Pseudonocardia sp. DSM 45834]
MRALRVHEPIGPDGLRLDEVDVPPPPDDTAVRVAVHAAGVGFIDTLLVRGRYQVKPPTPFVPGLEVAGAVESAPHGSGFSPGDCVFGHVMGGGFAETAWVPAARLAPLPVELSAVEGAAALVNHHTAIVALTRRGRLQRRDRVLVHGAGGGLGSAVVQIAAAFGNEVLAVAGSSERRELAARAGATTVYDHESWFEAVRAAGGVDVIVDPVGGAVFEQSVRCLRPEGRLITVGFTSGTIPSAAANRLLLRNASVVGAAWRELLDVEPGLFTDTAERLASLVKDGLRPLVGATFDLADGATALRLVEDRAMAGKIVLTTR